MLPTVSYVSTAADDRYATRLTVAPDGMGTLVVGSNRDARTRPIGYFQARLPPDLAQRLAAVVSGAAFAASATQPSLVPDESYRRIQVRMPDGAERDKLAGEQIATPPAFGEAEAVLHDAVAVLMKSPVAAMAMAMAPQAQQVQTGDALVTEVTLANLGRVSYRIPAPAQWSARGVSCELSALRSDIALASLGMQDQQFLHFDSGHLAAAQPPITDDAIRLSPGERVRLQFRSVIAWPPGQYRLELALTLTAVGDDGKPVFSGVLVSPPTSLQVAVP